MIGPALYPHHAPPQGNGGTRHLPRGPQRLQLVYDTPKKLSSCIFQERRTIGRPTWQARQEVSYSNTGEETAQYIIAIASPPQRTSPSYYSPQRGGGALDVTKTDLYTLSEAVVAAAGLPSSSLTDDTFCTNPVQNIIVIITPSDANAARYRQITSLKIDPLEYEVSSYLAPPDDTCKGVIRGVNIALTPERLNELIRTPQNPTAIGARCIKNTTTIVVLFNGKTVPDKVLVGYCLHRCSLYR